MSVKLIRMLLAAVVLVTSIANILFMLENLTMGVTERTKELNSTNHETSRRMMLREAVLADKAVFNGT